MFGMLVWLCSISDVVAKYDFNCGRVDKALSPYTKGDLTYICFHFMPYKVKLGFVIKIDEYTGFEIPDSFKLFETKAHATTNVHAQVDVYGDYSPPAVYLVKESKLAANVMTLVIKLNEGKLAGMRWDNDCYGCNKTDDCKKLATSYENVENKTVAVDYNTCTRVWPNLDTEKSKANLKVGV
jgi:hypothetical protein